MVTRPDIADEDWDAFVDAANPTSYLQRSAWAASKEPNGWRAVRWIGGESAGAQILVRRAAPTPWAVAYAPRGPLATTWDGRTIAEFTEAARELLARQPERIAYLRVDPGVEPGLLAPAGGGAEGGLADHFGASGWRQAPAVQPNASRIVDLSVGEADLWSGLRKKWRQYVNRARAAGIHVVEGDSGRVAEFHAIYAETARRAGFIIRSEPAYREVWAAFDRDRLARLLFAELPDGTPVATLLLLRSGATVTEPYGGATVAGGESRANYLLKWEAMNRSREAGATTYDMWGLSSPGIAHFKAGFGGREVHYPGAWDLILDPLGHTILDGARRARTWISRLQHGLDPRRGVSPDGTATPDYPDAASARDLGNGSAGDPGAEDGDVSAPGVEDGRS